jgi:hypothetical protein
MIYYITIPILVLIVAFVVFIAMRPAVFRVERSGRISAPGDVVFSIINDLHQWHRWSPWEKLDPDMQKTFEGPQTGPGSSHSWKGNKKVGAGRNTILDSKSPEFVSMKLEMYAPFACTNQVMFRLAPADAGTNVTWSMEGRNNFMAKAFSLLMSMDKMIGKDFEQGLANLNTAVQTASH